MLFVVSLFAATAMTHDRIARANGAPANDTFCGCLRPIGFRLALHGGKWDKDNRGNGGSAGGDLPRSQTRAEPSPPPKIFDWKRISNPRHASYFDSAAEDIGRSTSKGSLVSRSAETLPRLRFSLGLRWHPYLEQRAVQPSTAAWFGIGYYGGSGFLRNRIVFPIHDSEGQLVAYAGRSIDGSEPRYLFPPSFRKSQVVFNLHRAVGKSTGWAIVVEGFFDCLRVHQAGYRNVVALMGVSLSEVQEQILLERFQQLVLMLDGDEAGRRASQQLAARLRGAVSLSMAQVPSGRQPDQLSSEEMDRILRRASSAPGG
jgi:5S rRNA maturation endonuclease (ribonuclease M5)